MGVLCVYTETNCQLLSLYYIYICSLFLVQYYTVHKQVFMIMLLLCFHEHPSGKFIFMCTFVKTHIILCNFCTIQSVH